MLLNLILRRMLLIKYLFIGGVNTVFGYGVYWGLLQLDIHFAIAAFVSTILGTIFNFFTIGRLVFKSKNNRIFYKFVFVYAFLYFISTGGIAFIHNFDISYEIAGLIIIIPRAAIGYLLNKNWVFEK
ncbi:MAG: putative flippase GtrA [Methylophilaceae bacterium]|jgi:putative flippase GtrA|tara:strand:+ start:144 stop:524 length:381 start_codon:yes stop_codon:yes gene_type:complete